VDIEALPRRRTDHARILDRTKYTIKLYTTDGGAKLLRRPDGKVERQYRLNVGSLPVAYTSDKPEGAEDTDLLYIMDRAVTSFNRDGRIPCRAMQLALGSAVPVLHNSSSRKPFAFFATVSRLCR
jgi:hypothetical protein